MRIFETQSLSILSSLLGDIGLWFFNNSQLENLKARPGMLRFEFQRQKTIILTS